MPMYQATTRLVGITPGTPETMKMTLEANNAIAVKVLIQERYGASAFVSVTRVNQKSTQSGRVAVTSNG